MSESFGWFDPTEFDYDKDVTFDSTTNVTFNTDVSFEKCVDINIDMHQSLCIDGNYASVTADAEAIGVNTSVEIDASAQTVENTLSSASVVLVSAVG